MLSQFAERNLKLYAEVFT